VEAGMNNSETMQIVGEVKEGLLQSIARHVLIQSGFCHEGLEAFFGIDDTGTLQNLSIPQLEKIDNWFSEN
jgi:hypothetical protein